MFIDLVHCRSNQTKFGDRAHVLNEARIRRPAAGRQDRCPAGLLANGIDNERGKRAGLCHERIAARFNPQIISLRRVIHHVIAHLSQPGFQTGSRMLVVKADIDDRSRFGRNDVGRRIADIDQTQFPN